jgi:hypothetical protein
MRTDMNELAALPETVRKIALDEETVTLAAKPSSGPSPNSRVTRGYLTGQGGSV